MPSSSEERGGDKEKPRADDGKEDGEEEDSGLSSSDSGNGGESGDDAQVVRGKKNVRASNGADEDDSDGGEQEVQPKRKRAKGSLPESKKKKKKEKGKKGKRPSLKVAASTLLDEEAEESGEGSGEDDDEEGGVNEYEQDGFVVGDEEGSEPDSGSDSDVGRRRRKKLGGRLRRVREAAALDEDDWELLRESHMAARGVPAVEAPKSSAAVEPVDGEVRPQAPVLARDEQELESRLFGGDGQDDAFAAAQRRRRFREEEYQSEEDDFIEDDLGGLYADEGIGRMERGGQRSGEFGGPSQAQLNEAVEIFGDGILDMMEGQVINVDLAGAEEPQLAITSVEEPSKLRQRFFTSKDKEIQVRDRPERLQLRLPGRGEISEMERQEEARWIQSRIELDPLDRTLLSDGPARVLAADQRSNMIKAIEQVLFYLEVEGLEIPFINHHRGDYFKPHLSSLTLYRIYDLDEKWEKISSRRNRIMHVAEAMWKRRDALALQESEGAAAALPPPPAAAAATPSDAGEAEVPQPPPASGEVVGGDASAMDVDQGVSGDAAVVASGTVRDSPAAAAADQSPSASGLLSAMLLKDAADLFPESYRSLVSETDEDFLKDLQSYLRLVTLRGEKVDASGEGGGAGGIRRATRHALDLYRRCRRQEGLRELVKSFTLSASELGSRAAGLTPHDLGTVPEPQESPALLMNSLGLGTAALQSACLMVAQEVAAEPRVRRLCRRVFRDTATLTTEATDRGKEEIDYFHPAYGLQYLDKKPVRELLHELESRSTFLRVERARKDGYLTYIVDPPQKLAASGGSSANAMEMDYDLFLSKLTPLFGLPNHAYHGLEPLAEQDLPSWAHARSFVLRSALKLMMSDFVAEVTAELREAGRDLVVRQAADALAERLLRAPWAPMNRTPFQRLTNEPEVRQKLDEVRAVGIHLSPDRNEPSFAAAIDPMGVVIDHLVLPAQKGLLPEKLKEFIMEVRPNVVVVGAGAGQHSKRISNMLFSRRPAQGEGGADMVQGLVPEAIYDFRARNESEGFYEDVWDVCEVVLALEDVAQIFARSPRGEKEFPDYHPNLRTAACLARCIQDPLVEYAGMWTTMDSQGSFGYEMLHLRLHPLQSEVTKQMLLKVFEQRLMIAVNLVGVDVNAAVEFEHRRGLLQFVGGLGPRKAAALHAGVSRTDVFPDIYMCAHPVGPPFYFSTSDQCPARRCGDEPPAAAGGAPPRATGLHKCRCRLAHPQAGAPRGGRELESL
jgi:transcription elongation factor SPT6